jgi:hypothetical protein
VYTLLGYGELSIVDAEARKTFTGNSGTFECGILCHGKYKKHSSMKNTDHLEKALYISYQGFSFSCEAKTVFS